MRDERIRTSAQFRAYILVLSALSLSSAACEDESSPYRDASSLAETRDADSEPLGDAALPDVSVTGDAHASAETDSGVDPTSSADAAPSQHASVSLLDASDADASPPVDASSIDASDSATDGSSDAQPGDAANDAALADAVAPDAGPSEEAVPTTKQLVVGRAHGCSLDPEISGLLCWGDNQRGQTRVPTLDAPRFVAAGGDVTCAIERGGDVECWGDNSRRQLDVPTLLGRATQISVGDAHVCALTATGRVRCWGDNGAGQAQAPELQNVRAIGAGAQHSCALSESGVRCWGGNAQGQRDVPTLSGVTQLAVGGFHNCVIAQGAVQCWGGSIPALLSEIPTVNAPTALSSGKSHSCVIDRTGARCWGDPAARSLTPRELTWFSSPSNPRASTPRQIAIGGAGQQAFACARHLQGVTCWGDNSLRQTEYNGYPSHVLYRSQADIQAPASLVWSVLMDLDKYALWNPYTIAMRSTLKLGDPMIMTVKMSELITIEQIENIRVLEAEHKVCWGINTETPALNSGERCQWLEPLAGGGTRYITEDLIEGTLNLVVLGLFGSDVKNGFDNVASSLKRRAETLANP